MTIRSPPPEGAKCQTKVYLLGHIRGLNPPPQKNKTSTFTVFGWVGMGDDLLRNGLDVNGNIDLAW